MSPTGTVSGFEALICDFDDTLLATRQMRTLVLRDVLGHFGFDLEDAVLDKHWGEPFPVLLEALAPGVDHERFGAIYQKALRASAPEVNPGAHALLDLFHQVRAPVLVVTSSLRSLVEIDLSHANLLNVVDRLWGADDTQAWKPDPRVLTGAISHLDQRRVNRFRTLYVGDGLADHTVASAWGMPFVGVLTGSTTSDSFQQRGVHPPHVQGTLLALVALLKSGDLVPTT